MATPDKTRPQQRLRTRKDLLQAAARLLRTGGQPTLEEVASEALVSRATAYRYFPDVTALLAEASLDVGMPEPEALLSKASEDPVERLDLVDAAMHDVVLENEPQMRRMLAHTVMRALDDSAEPETPPRQNRRLPLIAAALAPARAQFTPAAQRRLEYALALILGTEGVIVGKDVLRIEDAELRRVKRWAIRALVEAARKPGR